MRKNMIRGFLVLIVAIFAAMGTAGCNDRSALSDSQVIAKIKDLALRESSQLGYDVEVRCIRDHIGSVGCTIGHIRHPSLPECDEMWVTEVHSSKWSSCVVRLCRKGSSYYLNFNPQDM